MDDYRRRAEAAYWGDEGCEDLFTGDTMYPDSAEDVAAIDEDIEVAADHLEKVDALTMEGLFCALYRLRDIVAEMDDGFCEATTFALDEADEAIEAYERLRGN
jgi:hypothetical protein